MFKSLSLGHWLNRGKEVTMYSKEQIDEVVNIDLYDYAIHNLDAIKEGNWARLRSNRSVCFKRGSSRYMDFSKQGIDGSGNLIDLLVKYYGETFKSVMESEIGIDPNLRTKSNNDYISVFALPKKDCRSKETMAYLTLTRSIPLELVRKLMDEELIYQGITSVGEMSYKNCVFVNKEKTYYETHGTLSYGKSFHGNGRREIDAYWSFSTGDFIDTVYICEAAIDAISLAALQGQNDRILYTSIGGVSNYKTIDRLYSAYGEKCKLAVDNDEAGEKCRIRYPQIGRIIPKNKDWNEDLKERGKHEKEHRKDITDSHSH